MPCDDFQNGSTATGCTSTGCTTIDTRTGSYCEPHGSPW